MMKQKILYIIFFLLCVGTMTSYAQRNITVKGRVMQIVNKIVDGEKVQETIPYEYVFVYPVPDKAAADAAKQQYDMYFDRKLVYEMFLEPNYALQQGQYATAVDGTYTVYDVPENGYLLFFPFAGAPKALPINGNLELEDIVFEAEDDGVLIDETIVEGKGSGLKIGDLTFGPYVAVKSTIPVESMLQKKNVRLLIQPYVVDCDSAMRDTTFLTPRAFYGNENELTQERRLDFNLNLDSLIANQVDSLRNKLNNERYNFDGLVFKKKDAKRSYRAYAEVFYEDYNGVLKQEKFVIKHCEDNKPMRFLDFKFGAMFLNPSDPAFRVEPTVDKHDAVGDINLQFLNGTAILDPNNPNNELEIARLQNEMLAIESTNNNYLRSVKIIGKASPDGNYNENKSLAGRRAAFAKEQIISKLSRYTRNRMTIESEAIVAGWEEVADTLAKDSLFAEAEAVREIAKKYEGNIQRQNDEMKRVTNYDLIKDTYLPKLRAVKYQYTYQTMRALSDTEIMEKFKQSKDTVNQPNIFFDRYEYWRLTNIVKDSTDLRDIYKRYYEFTQKSQNGKADELAACNYAAFLVREGVADSSMLLPYIKKQFGKTNISITDMNTGKPIVYNRIPVIANQLAMYVLCEDYFNARKMNAYLPPSDEQSMLYAFLMCLCGKYNLPFYAELVAKTSPNNDIVISIANGGTVGLRHARMVAERDLKDDNPRKWYFLAQIDMKEGKKGKGSDVVEHLLECFKVDEKYIEIADVDAVFVDNKGNKTEFDEAVDKYDKWKNGNKK